MPETTRLAAAAEFQADLPTGLCISCLAKDSAVSVQLRARRERLLRKINSPISRIQDWIIRGLDGIRNVARPRQSRGCRPSEPPQQSFERQLAQHGRRVSALTPASGITEMLEFYSALRISGCDPEQGDMLLYQWGTSDWGEGRRFEVGITRQLALDEDDDENLWQLSLTFRFPVAGSLEALGSGSKWCGSYRDLVSFGAFVRSHSAYATVADRSDGTVELTYEPAG
jgi:hypothetical protein